LNDEQKKHAFALSQINPAGGPLVVLYVMELSADQLHEDDAALHIAGTIAGNNLI